MKLVTPYDENGFLEASFYIEDETHMPENCTEVSITESFCKPKLSADGLSVVEGATVQEIAAWQREQRRVFLYDKMFVSYPDLNDFEVTNEYLNDLCPEVKEGFVVASSMREYRKTTEGWTFTDLNVL